MQEGGDISNAGVQLLREVVLDAPLFHEMSHIPSINRYKFGFRRSAFSRGVTCSYLADDTS